MVEFFFGIIIYDYDQTLPLFLKKIENLDVDQQQVIILFNLCSDNLLTRSILKSWIEQNHQKYKKINLVDSSFLFCRITHEITKQLFLAKLRDHYLANSRELHCSHCLILSSDIFIAPYTLKYLLEKDKSIIAPLLRPVPEEDDPLRNFFENNLDYFAVSIRKKLGTFKVACLQWFYLIKTDICDQLSFTENFKEWDFVTFSNNAHQHHLELYLCNEKEFGFFLHFFKNLSAEERQKFSLIGSELEITSGVLDEIFSAYVSKDPILQKHLKTLHLDGYEIFRVRNQDLYYLDDINDYIKNYFIKRGLVWEEYIENELVKYVKPGSVVLDIGAHLGTRALSFSRLVGEHGKVLAFEPQVKLFTELVINMYLNRCQNVICYHHALGSQTKWISMDLQRIPGFLNEGHSWVLENQQTEDIAYMLRLDDFKLTSVSFIKIDVEGYEMEVIRGGKETILRNKPIMIVEIFKGPENAQRLAEIENLGYIATFIGGKDYLFLPYP